MLNVGGLLDGKYRILSEIGRGGMSIVYLAINEKANKTWAVKEVRKSTGRGSRIMRESLTAELALLRRLHHPGLPAIIDVIDGDESIIIVMDYVEGKSLQSVLEQEGPQAQQLVIRWAAELCGVLGYLHRQTPPVIYRDMKPANVILRPDGHVTLIDFGTAREYKEQSPGDTAWLGTRGYAAPEQFGGRGQTDARTDIYSLGATMYHLLTGCSPADTQFVMYPVSRFRPELAGSGLEKLVAKCCRPEPEQRYQDCSQMMYALKHVHDEDDAVRELCRKRGCIFLLCILLAAAGAIGNVGFSLLQEGAAENSYRTYLSQAENSADFVRASRFYQNAVWMKPEKEAAYEKMLTGMTADGEITQEEKVLLDDILNAVHQTRHGLMSNLETLKAENPEGYAAFEYHLGCAYYIFYRNGQGDANQCLKKVVQDETLDGQERRIARSLITITDYYVYAAYGEGMGLWEDIRRDGEDDYTWRGLWETITEIASDPAVADEKAGGTLYSIAIYREAATQAATNLQYILDAGITRSQIEALLSAAEDYLSRQNTDTGNPAEKVLLTETETAVNMAKNELTAFFRRVGE